MKDGDSNAETKAAAQFHLFPTKEFCYFSLRKFFSPAGDGEGGVDPAVRVL